MYSMQSPNLIGVVATFSVIEHLFSIEYQIKLVDESDGFMKLREFSYTDNKAYNNFLCEFFKILTFIIKPLIERL